MANRNLTPRSWRQHRKMTMAGIARMLGIAGKNPSRTWQRYETGQAEPPIGIIAKVEMISEGQVNSLSWMKVRQDFRSRRDAEARP